MNGDRGKPDYFTARNLARMSLVQAAGHVAALPGVERYKFYNELMALLDEYVPKRNGEEGADE